MTEDLKRTRTTPVGRDRDALANLPLWNELLASSKAVSGGDFGHFPRLKAAVETVEKALSVARKEPEPAPKPINLGPMKCPNLGQMCSTPRTCTDLGECRITHPAYSQNHVIGELNALAPLCKKPPCPTPGICVRRKACVGEITAADAPDPQASAIKAIVVHILAKETYDTASLDRHPLRHLAPDWKR